MAVTYQDWMFETCDFSLLTKYECAHCMRYDDDDITPDHDYEILSIFPSQYSGTCILNDSHRIRKGDRVSKIQRADNPMIPIPGVACKYCTLDFPRAKN